MFSQLKKKNKRCVHVLQCAIPKQEKWQQSLAQFHRSMSLIINQVCEKRNLVVHNLPNF